MTWGCVELTVKTGQNIDQERMGLSHHCPPTSFKSGQCRQCSELPKVSVSETYFLWSPSQPNMPVDLHLWIWCYAFLAFLLYFMCMGVYLHIWLYISCVPSAHGDQKKALDPRGLELQMLYWYGTMWVLRFESRSSGRAVHRLNHQPISLASFFFLRFIFIYVYMCAPIYMYGVCVQVPLEALRGPGVGSPGTGLMGSYELHVLGAGNRTLVLWENSKCS